MGLFDFIKNIILESDSSKSVDRGYSTNNNTSNKSITNNQFQYEKYWHGIKLSELNKLAKSTRRGKYVEVDQYDFLVIYYTSNSDKKIFSVQCKLNGNKKIERMTHNYYPGQWRDGADEFIDKANQSFNFIY